MSGPMTATLRPMAIAIACAAGLGVFSAPAMADDVLVMEIEGRGTVEIELFEEQAPQHAERLRTLAAEGAYDGVAFHRVIDGFMAQTGDVEFGTRDAFETGRAGTGGSALPNLPAEFSDISFERGVVGMARSQDPNSANSQFFIMFGPAPHLDGQYTAVGRVVSGMAVVDEIRRGSGPNGMVSEPDFIETMRVDTR